MQLPKQFKSWTQFYKQASGIKSSASKYIACEGEIYTWAYVCEMALKELLAVMPTKSELHICGVSCENAEKYRESSFFFRLKDILY